MATAFDQFKEFLREMFQYDTNDLDFGIFKILKLKRKYIEQFISGDGPDDLKATVDRELARVEKVDAEAARNWLASFAFLFGDMGRPMWAELEKTPLDEVKQARFRALFTLPVVSDTQREEAERHLATWLESQKVNPANIEERLYNYLLNFFELYYQNGDFGYNSRAANAFKVPYEADYDGSDTFFHWKHKDSYYIKTGASFPSVKCAVAGKSLEFRLETGAEREVEATAQNNNKDKEIKLYRLARIEEQEGVWQVVFHLAKAGTAKTELYPKLWATVFDAEADLTPYLFKKEAGGDGAKPIFNELAADHDKTDGGQVKGVNQLRLKEESYYKELAKRPEFAGLGKNEADRVEALQANSIAAALYQLDKALNQFYVGNDADYFIHKDLRGFLTREKDRFIKNVIFSDLDSLLNRNIDNTTLIIGRGFNAVAGRIIEFLDTLETFQRNIFTLKKKVIDTHWLISVGKIPEKFHGAIIARPEQVRQFSEMYGVTIERAEHLKEHPTLVVDTGLFDPEWALELLSDPAFDNLDEQTDGLLIHSENWQALNILQEKYRGQVKCIYIDPPYNTGNDGFIYKDSFRHSSWATMMSDRLSVSEKLLADNGAMLISINDLEMPSLVQVVDGMLQSQRQETLIWKSRISEDTRSLTGISNDHEYIVALGANGNLLFRGAAKDLAKFANPDNDPRGKWRSADLTGLATKEQRPNLHYVLANPETGREYSCPPKGWRYDQETMNQKIIEKRILWPSNGDGRPRHKLFRDEMESEFKHFSSVINGIGTGDGTRDLSALFEIPTLTFPKPQKFVSTLVEQATNNTETVLDFFGGSGTTGHAVIALNKTDGEKGKRKFVLVEMGAYFDTVLTPRIQKVMYSLNWRDGRPIADKVDGYQGIVKVQRLEQYEDLLANLETAWDGETLPKGLPVQYLFRPEHNRLVASIDLSRPFTQTIKAGKTREEKTIDLMETWLYLQGYWIKSRRVYPENDRDYLAVETTVGVLVVFRDIDPGEDDSAALNAIIDRYKGESGELAVTRLEVNFDADIRTVKLPVSLVQAADFDRGASWN
ncbi:site-specific DNA-methyltransferase [Geobacter argillaceus]|uniref:site-specific DNA-methyltransferase (adenine-specific) n=1 Tax=Geobacter argillaceus TaxID=345631 RepID=A0A562VNJ0_9BACT|nr:site-specific DNA-methyltransferase [Geobacter argillaceus]TWJ19465.1 adenine-specific DNA-methyltransferase [Geobacter argillaceus]